MRRHGSRWSTWSATPHAHAKIVSIDVAAALAHRQALYGTLAGDEVAIQTDPFFEMSTPPGNEIKDYALAVGKVRFMGKPSPRSARARASSPANCAELVEVEYEPLEVPSTRGRQ